MIGAVHSRRRGRRAAIAVVLLWLTSSLATVSRASTHPHGPDSEVYFSGTIRRIDLEARTLVIDAVDPRSMSRRDLLAYLDRDATIRRGKQRIELADLEPGQRGTFTGFRELDQDDRIVLSDIRVSDRRR